MSNATPAAAETVILSGSDLPACHTAREELADTLVELGYKVRVNRFGTGKGAHSGVVSGCGVRSIEVSAQWYLWRHILSHDIRVFAWDREGQVTF